MQKEYKPRILENPLYQKHKEKVKYMMVGGVNTAADFLIFALLANVFGVIWEVSHLVATGIVIALSFVLNYSFVWESKKSRKETAPKFVIVSLFSAWVVQTAMLWIVISLAGDNDTTRLVGKVAGILAGTVSNYLGYKHIFR